MNIQSIISSIPIGQWIICISLGLIYAAGLYVWKDKDNSFSANIKKLLFACRFVLVALLYLFLFSPLIKSIQREVEKPILVVAYDNSQSIISQKDSAYYKQDYIQQFNNLVATLGDKYDVKQLVFSDKVADKSDAILYTGKETNLSNLFTEIESRYEGRAVKGIVLSTDGIVNKGANPLYTNFVKQGTPIYSIALGDSVAQKDVFIKLATHNDITYLNNKFLVEVEVAASKTAGQKVELAVYNGNAKEYSTVIEITSDDFYKNVSIELIAKRTGIQQYRVELTKLKDEVNVVNNRYDFFVDVIDSRDKILIVAATPHPDIAAIHAALSSKESYDVKVVLQNDLQSIAWKDYSLLILHQLPYTNATVNQQLKQAIDKFKLSVCYVIGQQTNLSDFAQFNQSLFIQTGKNVTEAEPLLNETFSLFTLTDDEKKAIQDWPPLSVPFGNYTASTNAQVFSYQKINNIATKYPQIVFAQREGIKSTVIVGEGLWKWKLADYKKNGSNDVFTNFIAKIAQYLALRDNKSLLRVNAKKIFLENESIVLNAELYNESYELDNRAEVKLVLQNEAGKKFNYTFSKTNNTYVSNLGSLPAGKYMYEASSSMAGKSVFAKGSFVVQPLVLELANLTADHSLLRSLATATQGKVFQKTEIEKLSNELAQKEVKSISYAHKHFDELISLKWMLVLIIALLSIEWITRKRNGSY